MRSFGIVSLIVAAIAVVGVYLSYFTVDPTEQALVLQFGKPKRVLTTPGLYFKIPFVENVSYFDKRLLDIDTAPQEVIASDQKRLVVDAFARYHIVNPLLFFQSVRDQATARAQFSNILESSLRGVLGASTFEAVVRDDREGLMQTIAKEINRKAKPYGMEFVNVRIKRVDLPQANSEAIYKRMQTERERQAAEFRAEGAGAAARIRATADREVTVIKADAVGEASRIRGDGDAKKAAIFAKAYGQDPDFFAFYRSMQAYRDALKPGDTRFVMGPNSQFFEYFNDAAGGPNVAGTTATNKEGLAPNASFAPKDTSKVKPTPEANATPAP